MIRKGLTLGIILLFVGTVMIPGITANINDTNEGYEKSDIYFFAFAFVVGKFDNSTRWFDYFKIWNPGYVNTTMYVLGYSSYQHTFIPVKAYEVFGSLRIGLIGWHHCCIFAFGPGGVTVMGRE